MGRYEFSSTCWSLEEARDICKAEFDSVVDDDFSKCDTWAILDCANQIMEAFERCTEKCGVSQSEDVASEPKSNKSYDIKDATSGVTVARSVPLESVMVIVANYEKPIQVSPHKF